MGRRVDILGSMSRAVLWLGLTGCLRIADFKPPEGTGDGGVDGVDPNQPATGVTATTVGSNVVVTGTFFELRFGARGAHYPDSLKIGAGANVLALSQTCEESAMGIQVHPAFVIDSENGSGPPPEIIHSGAVVQVRLAWTNDWSCAAGMNTATGSSIFTVYPDGRIVRHDDVRFTGTTMVGTTDCACNLPANNTTHFTLRSYTTLREDAFPRTPPPAGGDGSPVELVGTSTQVCSSAQQHSILYGFENEWARLRQIPQAPNGFAHALSYDMFIPFTIQNDGDYTTSTMLMSPDPGACTALTKRMLDLRTRPTISVAEVGVPSAPVTLTISEQHGMFELAPAMFVRDRSELRSATTVPVPGGFVVSLKFAGPRNTVTTSLPISAYRVAKPTADTALIYIVPPLDNTTPITVTAEP
jgi:hypothetical protein